MADGSILLWPRDAIKAVSGIPGTVQVDAVVDSVDPDVVEGMPDVPGRNLLIHVAVHGQPVALGARPGTRAPGEYLCLRAPLHALAVHLLVDEMRGAVIGDIAGSRFEGTVRAAAGRSAHATTCGRTSNAKRSAGSSRGGDGSSSKATRGAPRRNKTRL